MWGVCAANSLCGQFMQEICGDTSWEELVQTVHVGSFVNSLSGSSLRGQFMRAVCVSSSCKEFM